MSSDFALKIELNSLEFGTRHEFVKKAEEHKNMRFLLVMRVLVNIEIFFVLCPVFVFELDLILLEGKF